MTAMTAALRRLHADRGGSVLIEFAFGLPVFVGLTLAGLEAANLALANQQISSVARMISDVSARGRATMDEGEIQEIFFGAKESVARLEFAQRGRIILSSVQNNAAGNGQWIVWQRCTGVRATTSKYGPADTGKTGSTLPAVGGLDTNGVRLTPGITAPTGNALMFVEVEYQYKPLITDMIFGRPVIRYEKGFVVRERNNFGITNTTSKPVANCTLYNA